MMGRPKSEAKKRRGVIEIEEKWMKRAVNAYCNQDEGSQGGLPKKLMTIHQIFLRPHHSQPTNHSENILLNKEIINHM